MLDGILQRTYPILTRSRSNFRFPQRRCLLTLAIETSCDDTCVAILSKGSQAQDEADSLSTTLHFHEKVTARNTGHGGIHPIEALDSHRSHLSKLIDRSIEQLPDGNSSLSAHRQIFSKHGQVKQKPDFISVTRGPGMRSNLSCGLDTAKGLATAWQIPMVGVHHMQAHALTPRLVYALQRRARDVKLRPLSESQPHFPFLTLLVSGGHTMLVQSKSLTEHTILADTIDIAIGDALDKCGRLILPEEIRCAARDTAYGKHLSLYAFPSPAEFSTWPVPRRRSDEIDKQPNKFGWQMNAALSDTRDLKFSFAGLPSRVNSLMNNSRDNSSERQTQLSAEERLLLARTAIGTAFEHLASRTIIALESLSGAKTKNSKAISTDNDNHQISTLVVSGGVAANDFLRYFLRSTLDIRGFGNVDLVFPPVDLCTDNAAMIAWAGIEMFEAGYTTDLSCEALKKWNMDSGISGFPGHGNDASGRGREGVNASGILGVDGWIHV